MSKNITLKIASLIIPAFTLLYSCQQPDNIVAKREKVIADSVAFVYENRILQDSVQRVNQAAYSKLVTAGEELYKLAEFDKAITNYENARAYTSDEDKLQQIQLKIEAIKTEKRDLEAAKASTEKLLIGEKIFGQQFIVYGTADIRKIDGTLHLRGKQYSEDKLAYTIINGILTILNDRKMSFEGNIKVFTRGCCGPIDITGTYTFEKTGTRKYWRLQEFDTLCSQYTCAYYIDIFE